jgi:hypothetical protein
LGGTKLPRSSPGLHQLAQPRRVGDVGLAARDLFDVPGVAQRQLERVLEHMPDRLPEDAGRLHRDVRDAMRLKPVAQRDQPAHGRGELGQVLLAPAARRRHPHARGHLRLVHVKRADALEHGLHRCSFPRESTRSAARRNLRNRRV